MGHHWRVFISRYRLSSFLLPWLFSGWSVCVIGYFAWWEISGHTVVFMRVAASRICTKQHIAFLYICQLGFFLCVSCSRWYIHTIVCTQPQIGINPFLFYLGEKIFVWLKTCQRHSMLSHELCFICIHAGVDVSCCFIHDIQQKFYLCRCICEKRYIIYVIYICSCFCRILFFSANFYAVFLFHIYLPGRF